MLKNYTTYFIQYKYKYIEPDYDTFNQYPNYIYDIPENPVVDQKKEFNSDIKTYYGRTLKIKFKLCHE